MNPPTTPPSGNDVPSCDRVRALLPERLAGPLADEREHAVRDHLARCSGCARASADLAEAARRLALLPAPSPTLVAAARLRLRRALERSGSSDGVPAEAGRRGLGMLRRSAAAASIALLSLVPAVLVGERRMPAAAEVVPIFSAHLDGGWLDEVRSWTAWIAACPERSRMILDLLPGIGRAPAAPPSMESS